MKIFDLDAEIVPSVLAPAYFTLIDVSLAPAYLVTGYTLIRRSCPQPYPQLPSTAVLMDKIPSVWRLQLPFTVMAAVVALFASIAQSQGNRESRQLLGFDVLQKGGMWWLAGCPLVPLLAGVLIQKNSGTLKRERQLCPDNERERPHKKGRATPEFNRASEIRIYVRNCATRLVQMGILRGVDDLRCLPDEYWKFRDEQPIPGKKKRSPEFLADTSAAVRFAEKYASPVPPQKNNCFPPDCALPEMLRPRANGMDVTDMSLSVCVHVWSKRCRHMCVRSSSHKQKSPSYNRSSHLPAAETPKQEKSVCPYCTFTRCA
jgi:hypothetical protein